LNHTFRQLTIEDFAANFSVSPDQIPDICKEVITKSDFRYTVVDGAQKEDVLDRVSKTLDSGTLKVSGPHRKGDWEKGWTENLTSFISHKYELNELIPKFVRQKEIMRFNNEYILPVDSNFETNFVTVLRFYLFSKYLATASKVYEFGCGTGLNLVAVGKLFPQKEMYGLDWSAASCSIVDALAEKLKLNLKSILFDMFKPDETLPLDRTSAVFTIGAMEQLGVNFASFAQFLLNKKPLVVINIEALYELHDKNSRFGQVARSFIEKRNYLRGYYDFLKQMQENRRIEIMEVRNTIGGLYHDAYTYIVWRVLD
jgi:cyclopropane fatty-acyl-phospholipid synthase-like methyltransferase